VSEAANYIDIIKLNTQNDEVWRYQGRIIDQDPSSLLVEAFFNINDKPFHGITIRRDDRSIERYFSDRWYNIFEIHDRDDDRLKAWYCNITKPAEFSPGRVTYVDLALDLLVYPDGDYITLDHDEFEALNLDPMTSKKALKALKSLTEIIENKRLVEVLRN
jgi:predicted RNA-binding protein associated with RNAse of E/G family